MFKKIKIHDLKNKRIYLFFIIAIIMFTVAMNFYLNYRNNKEIQQPFYWIEEEKSFEQVKHMYDWEIIEQSTGELSIIDPVVELYGLNGSLYTIDEEHDGIVNNIRWYRTLADRYGNIPNEYEKSIYKDQFQDWYEKIYKEIVKIYGEPFQKTNLSENSKTAYWKLVNNNKIIEISIYIIGTNIGYTKSYNVIK